MRGKSSIIRPVKLPVRGQLCDSIRMKRALITGFTGQDGTYLAELLLEKGYSVSGLVRRSSAFSNTRFAHLSNRIELIGGDLLDSASLNSAVERVNPDEVYNLAAQTFVPASWEQPILTSEYTGTSVCRMLEAVRRHAPRARFYQASSSEMFGNSPERPQNEGSPFYPRSPYGVAKLYGHWITVNYRESYGMHASSGILFNHESPRRGLEFVTRKITWHAARIKLGLASELRLGNLDARRDWGYAGDYVRAMWLMTQAEKPGTYVIGTGETHSVREFVQTAFGLLDLDWEKYVRTESALERPAEVDHLCADPSRAYRELGWKPEVPFRELVRRMVEADLELAQSERELNSTTTK